MRLDEPRLTRSANDQFWLSLPAVFRRPSIPASEFQSPAANASATPSTAPCTETSTAPPSSVATSTAPASTSWSNPTNWTNCVPPRTKHCAWSASWLRRSLIRCFLYLVLYGPTAEPAYCVGRIALGQRQRWPLVRMVQSRHRQVVLVRRANTTLVLHVLQYPCQVWVCPQTVWPLAKEPAEELRLAGMLIEAAGGKVD